MANNGSHSHLEVVVIGGGQAGLAIGYFLARQGRDFTILEAAGEAAAAWKQRWESLTLFTSARYDALPGLDFPGDPDRYPSRDEVAAYLTDYAQGFDLPVALNSRVRAIRRAGAIYLVDLDDRTYEADQVVVATGPFQIPFVPAIAEGLGPEVEHFHSTKYRSPRDIPDGRVLVVGGGNTGYQIAEELSGLREVHISIGSPQKPLPQRILGRDLFWYLDKTGLIRKTTETRIGRRLQASEDTLIGSSPRSLRRHGIEFHQRALDAAGSTVTFSDNTKLEVRSVIWATGFRLDHSWIQVPIFDEHGDVLHHRGVTESPGLYLLGLPWQHTRGSALLGFIRDDAEYIAQQTARAATRLKNGNETGSQPLRRRKMQAIVQAEYGPADVLHVEEIDRPTIADDEVLIRVQAAGLDRGTWHQMTGQPYLFRLIGAGLRRPKNLVAGLDVAGTVVAVGAAVARFNIGDEVFGISRGSFAEYACASEDKLVRKPQNLTFDQAAIVAISGLTALQSLSDVGHLQPGQYVLIVGASGGVGTYALQIAKAFGANVTGVCSTTKLDLVRSIGANHAIDYTQDDFADSPEHYDLILDIGGNSSLARLRRALTPTGTLVIVGGEQGGSWTGGIGRQLRAVALSPFVRQRLAMKTPREHHADLDRLVKLVEAGELTPIIDKTYPLRLAPDAMRHLEAGLARGKLVITMTDAGGAADSRPSVKQDL
jgi:putative flavoprotein involved in K+ transport